MLSREGRLRLDRPGRPSQELRKAKAILEIAGTSQQS
jgi:hypothetical protein